MAENVSIVIRAVNRTKGVYAAIKRQSRGLAKSLTGIFGKAGGLLGGLGIAVGGAGLIKFLISANVEAQNLKVRLETFTGSAVNAAAVFKQLATFAAETPFELQDSVNAFIDLRAVGIDPTEESLRKMADVAAAFGTSIVDLSAAIRSAVKGELEPIGKFGAVFRTEGDKIKATFNGVVTIIDRTAVGITNYIELLGESEGVSGSAARQMNTLGGAISNLKDNLFQLATTVGEGGVGDMLFEMFQKLNNFLEKLRENPDQVRFWVDIVMGAFKIMGVAAWNFMQIVFDVGTAIGNALQVEFAVIKLAFFTMFDAVGTKANEMMAGLREKAESANTFLNAILDPVNTAARAIAGVDQPQLLPDLGEAVVPSVQPGIDKANAEIEQFSIALEQSILAMGRNAKEAWAPVVELWETVAAGWSANLAGMEAAGEGLRLFGPAVSSFQAVRDFGAEADLAITRMKAALKGLSGTDREVAQSTKDVATQIQRLHDIFLDGELTFEKQAELWDEIRKAQLAVEAVTTRMIGKMAKEAATLLKGLELGGELAVVSQEKLNDIMDRLRVTIAAGTTTVEDRIRAQTLLNELSDKSVEGLEAQRLAEEAANLAAAAGGELGAEAEADALVRTLEIRERLLELLETEGLANETLLAIKQALADIDDRMAGRAVGIDAIFKAMLDGATAATFEIQNLADALNFTVASALAGFATAWGSAFEAAGKGAKGLGKAVLKGTLQGIAGTAKAKSAETAIAGAEALAKGLTNPVFLAQAAQLFAVSAAYGALAAKLGGGGGGAGGAGGGGFGGGLVERTDNAAGDGATGTIVIQGGLINMDDPVQAQAFEDAVNRLASAGRIEIVGA